MRPSASDPRPVEPSAEPKEADVDDHVDGDTMEVDRPPTPPATTDGFAIHSEPPEWHGCAGFGQIGLRPTWFPSLTAERDYMGAEVERERRDINELKRCLRDWDDQLRAIREASPWTKRGSPGCDASA